MVRKIATITLFLLLNNVFYGQTAQDGKGRVLAIDILNMKPIKVGDTIAVRVRNLSSSGRGFTIQAVSLSKEPYFYNSVYSAFFNNDGLFFQKLEASQKKSKKDKLSYILPNYEVHLYEIGSQSEKLLNFIAKGTPLQKRVPIKLRITTDIIADKADTIYSEPLYFLSVPN